MTLSSWTPVTPGSWPRCGLVDENGERIALVNTRAQFLERQRLEEDIVAPVAPRIPSISALVAGTSIEFICGSVASLDAVQRRIRITTDTQQRDIAFDQAIYALGSNVDVDNVPGAAEHAYRLDPGRRCASSRSTAIEAAGESRPPGSKPR